MKLSTVKHDLQQDVSVAAKAAMSSSNQQIRPVQQDRHGSSYGLMLQKLDTKKSTYEIIQAYSA